MNDCENQTEAVPTFLDSRNGPFWLEITLNHPRTPSFNKLLGFQQHKLYLKILNDLKAFRYDIIDHSFEISADGNYHCHALFKRTQDDTIHFPLGCISDTVKTYLLCMPKKYATYKTGCMYAKWKRYSGPGICVQYTDNKKRADEWQKYLSKYKI